MAVWPNLGSSSLEYPHRKNQNRCTARHGTARHARGESKGVGEKADARAEQKKSEGREAAKVKVKRTLHDQTFRNCQMDDRTAKRYVRSAASSPPRR